MFTVFCFVWYSRYFTTASGHLMDQTNAPVPLYAPHQYVNCISYPPEKVRLLSVMALH